MAMDKMLAFIVLFLIVSVVMAAVLVMGAVPAIFKTKDLVNQTQITLHEDQQRAQQVKQILESVKLITEDNNAELKYYIDRQNNTTRKLLENQERVMNQHNIQGGIHHMIQELVKNITIENNKLIDKLGNENNAMLRSILIEMGKNPDKVIKDYYKKYPNGK
jgi:hypothetical protein